MIFRSKTFSDLKLDNGLGIVVIFKNYLYKTDDKKVIDFLLNCPYAEKVNEVLTTQPAKSAKFVEDSVTG